jgi:DNA-binding NarL/FixJ family response regulator
MSHVSVPETKRIVLHVNDSPGVEQNMFQWLFERGVALLRANSTAAALELLGRARCDAVITNLRRFEYGAKAKNNNAGIELTQMIRRSDPHIPIFIYTMNIDQATRESAQRSGATLITTSPTELQAALKACGI